MDGSPRLTHGDHETVSGNDLFYWPPGHNVKVEADAEIVMFSPGTCTASDPPHDREGEWLTRPHRATKQRLLDVGLIYSSSMGTTAWAFQALLAAANTPKGSFYHHFTDKQTSHCR